MALRMCRYGTCNVWRKNAIIKDEKGLPNFMTLFFMDPADGKPDEKDIPDMFKVRGKIMQGVAISQFFNTNIKGVPCSLPYAMPWKNVSLKSAQEACSEKGKNWHLLTNTEFVYLLGEARKMAHTIHGNTCHGVCADAPDEKGVLYDGYCTLTGLDPLAWSHDGTADGVFGLCGNYWEPVTGLRLAAGVVQYIKENDAAAVDSSKDSKEWITAAVDGKELKLYGNNGVTLTTGEVKKDWDGAHYSELRLDGLEEVPKIALKLGLVPPDYKTEKAGIWADSALDEALPYRGSAFGHTSHGGPAALYLYHTRAHSYHNISFRSALLLENWELVTEALEGA